MADAGEGLKQHPLLEKLGSPPSSEGARAGTAQFAASQIPGVCAISGYLAKDPQEGHWRVYLTLDFNQFLTINEGDIVGSALLATEDNPTRPNIVWVKAAANLQHTITESRQVQAQFLTGSLISQFHPTMPRTPAGQFSPNIRWETHICTRIPDDFGCGHSANCSFDPCPGHGTAVFICGSGGCPGTLVCGFTRACPSARDLC